jgi:hypothetical protein
VIHCNTGFPTTCQCIARHVQYTEHNCADKQVTAALLPKLGPIASASMCYQLNHCDLLSIIRCERLLFLLNWYRLSG